jgi:hypothetical protein
MFARGPFGDAGRSDVVDATYDAGRIRRSFLSPVYCDDDHILPLSVCYARSAGRSLSDKCLGGLVVVFWGLCGVGVVCQGLRVLLFRS